ncbi:hypothetical protein VTL71DRAFT_10351 [Oculimacula yallundae]|uniref:Gfd2/YDR514C-like C-terminal domain-containing protein n=1 Tax=Oculimacula yallundae TaxID=86028 RepID=A0ABR4CTA5_9HELO
MIPLFIKDEASVGGLSLMISGLYFQKGIKISHLRSRISRARRQATQNLTWATCFDNLASDVSNLDALFISIDFENPDKIASCAKSGLLDDSPYVSVGISILDTRDLHNARLPASRVVGKTYNICVGNNKIRKQWQDRRFLFGKTIWIPKLKYMKPSIELAIDRSRNIIFVGQAFDIELKVLRELGVDLKTSVVGTIDTYKLDEANTKEVPLGGNRSLKGILARLGLPVECCHIGGNDANYTLRAMLLLTAEGFSRSKEEMTDAEVERVSRLRAIALSPIAHVGAVPPSPPASGSESDGESESEEE